MSEKFTHFNILLSCPSDMDTEQVIIRQVVDKINETDARFKKVHFDIKHWSKDVLFSYGVPQQKINEEIVYPSDLIIALFGLKLGTPTERYASGTIEEIEKMIEMQKQVFVCFSEKKIVLDGDSDIDTIQNIIKVKEFKKNYNGLYISYKSDKELMDKVENQLRLYLSKIPFNIDSNTVSDIAFTYQELQGIISDISYAREVIFCARTGKIFLTGHYNQLKELIQNGGKFNYVTSEDFNVFGDNSEFKTNQSYAQDMIKNLKLIAPDRVDCFHIDNPVNNTYLYIKMDSMEKINVKFNFQIRMKERHPMFWINSGDPIFNVFFDEIRGLMLQANIVSF